MNVSISIYKFSRAAWAWNLSALDLEMVESCLPRLVFYDSFPFLARAKLVPTLAFYDSFHSSIVSTFAFYDSFHFPIVPTLAKSR